MGGEMKKKSFSRVELQIEKYAKTGKLMRECVRRNKDYIRDFELIKEGKLNDVQKGRLARKWRIWGGKTLGDPNDSAPISGSGRFQYYLYPENEIPYSSNSFFVNYESRRSKEIRLFRPGDKGLDVKGGKVSGKEFKDWEILDDQNRKYEKLTKKNCPHYISITIEVQPWFSDKVMKETLVGEFEAALKLVRDAQKVVLKKKTFGPRDDDAFEKFMTAFDYRDKNPKMTLNEIALKMFPDATYESKKGKQRASPEAIDKVRYYLGRADYYINKQGWREL
jgi:hypothetical protein